MGTLTPDLNDQFFLRVEKLCMECKCRPWDILAVWNSESGINAKAHNPDGDASGIFQAMPDTLRGLGWTKGPDAFRQLSAAEQVPYAERYYRPYTGRLVNAAACYVANFLPADLALASNPDNVLVQRDGRRGWAYTANSIFDKNKDYRITVKELIDAIARNSQTARFADVMFRMDKFIGGTAPKSPTGLDPGMDLGSVIGVQRALMYLGYDCGPTDGILGPLTRGAIVHFQKDRGLSPDGIYGPLTRAELRKAITPA